MFLLIAVIMTGILTNCSDDSMDTPVIKYIRVTDPLASDSLLETASQGQMIAIMGENLQSTEQIWFNDQPAVLNAAFISNHSIIVSVPSQIPLEITNKLKLVFANGETLIYDFTVDISKPRIDRIKNEYVKEGEIATFYGDFFYEPIVVTFAGGLVANLYKVEDQTLMVEVPVGVEPGPVTISTNFGVTVTDSWFHDGRNIIASFDVPLTNNANGTWHGASYIVSSDPVIPVINNKFTRMNNQLGAGAWFELYVGEAVGDIATETKNIPEDAFNNPEGYNLKFELNTLASLSGAKIRIFLGGNPSERGENYYVWMPNLNTQGEWETISIPWEDVYAANKSFPYNPGPGGYAISIHFADGAAVTANFGMDNIRVVPKTTN